MHFYKQWQVLTKKRKNLPTNVQQQQISGWWFFPLIGDPLPKGSWLKRGHDSKGKQTIVFQPLLGE